MKEVQVGECMEWAGWVDGGLELSDRLGWRGDGKFFLVGEPFDELCLKIG